MQSGRRLILFDVAILRRIHREELCLRTSRFTSVYLYPANSLAWYCTLGVTPGRYAFVSDSRDTRVALQHIAINKPPKDQPIQDDFHNTLSDSWFNMSDCPSAKESPPHGADSAATKEGDSTPGVTQTQSDSPITAKEEPLEFEHEGDGESEDKGDNVEGSIKRPRLRLSQACE